MMILIYLKLISSEKTCFSREKLSFQTFYILFNTLQLYLSYSARQSSKCEKYEKSEETFESDESLNDGFVIAYVILNTHF